MYLCDSTKTIQNLLWQFRFDAEKVVAVPEEEGVPERFGCEREPLEKLVFPKSVQQMVNIPAQDAKPLLSKVPKLTMQVFSRDVDPSVLQKACPICPLEKSTSTDLIF